MRSCPGGQFVLGRLDFNAGFGVDSKKSRRATMVSVLEKLFTIIKFLSLSVSLPFSQNIPPLDEDSTEPRRNTAGHFSTPIAHRPTRNYHNTKLEMLPSTVEPVKAPLREEGIAWDVRRCPLRTYLKDTRGPYTPAKEQWPPG
jgi:hypothetical protein